MIGERIASGCAKNHKVFSTDADEGCEQRGSFRKVTRSRRAEDPDRSASDSLRVDTGVLEQQLEH